MHALFSGILMLMPAVTSQADGGSSPIVTQSPSPPAQSCNIYPHGAEEGSNADIIAANLLNYSVVLESYRGTISRKIDTFLAEAVPPERRDEGYAALVKSLNENVQNNAASYICDELKVTHAALAKRLPALITSEDQAALIAFFKTKAGKLFMSARNDAAIARAHGLASPAFRASQHLSGAELDAANVFFKTDAWSAYAKVSQTTASYIVVPEGDYGAAEFTKLIQGYLATHPAIRRSGG